MTIWEKVRADKPIKLRVYRSVKIGGITRRKLVRGIVPDEVALGNQPPEKWLPVMSERRER